MRKNELNSLNELKSQYIGVWGPSDNHWYGLDFSYHGCEYRLHTGSMYGENEFADSNGALRQFGLYRKTGKSDPNHPELFLYELLDERQSLDDLLKSTVIDNKSFSEVIMDDDTVLLGQD